MKIGTKKEQNLHFLKICGIIVDVAWKNSSKYYKKGECIIF